VEAQGSARVLLIRDLALAWLLGGNQQCHCSITRVKVIDSNAHQVFDKMLE